MGKWSSATRSGSRLEFEQLPNIKHWPKWWRTIEWLYVGSKFETCWKRVAFCWSSGNFAFQKDALCTCWHELLCGSSWLSCFSWQLIGVCYEPLWEDYAVLVFIVFWHRLDLLQAEFGLTKQFTLNLDLGPSMRDEAQRAAIAAQGNWDLHRNWNDVQLYFDIYIGTYKKRKTCCFWQNPPKRTDIYRLRLDVAAIESEPYVAVLHQSRQIGTPLVWQVLP